MIRRTPGGWRIVPTPMTGGPLLSDAAVIPGTTHLWAVGQWQPGGLIERWNGHAWSTVPNPRRQGRYLTAITVLSPRNVWAVGGTQHDTTLIEHFH